MKTMKVEIEVPVFEGFEFEGYRVPVMGDWIESVNGKSLIEILMCLGVEKCLVYRKLKTKIWVDATQELIEEYFKPKWGESINCRWGIGTIVWQEGFLKAINGDWFVVTDGFIMNDVKVKYCQVEVDDDFYNEWIRETK